MPTSPGLAEQYDAGRHQAARRQAIQRRIRQPGAELYLVTTFAGEPIVGNIVSLPAGVLSRPGLVETDYLRSGDVDRASSRLGADLRAARRLPSARRP